MRPLAGALVLALAPLLACACGGGGATAEPPAPPDARPPSVCELPPSLQFVVTSLHIAPLEDGMDLDGDGDTENQFGNMPAGVRSAIGAGYDSALVAGEWLVATLFDGLDDPPSASDPEVGFHLLNVSDADVPADPSNNHTGSGTFWAESLFLDLNCESTTRTTGAIVDRVYHGARPRLDFPLNTGTGAIELVNMKVEAIFDETFTSAHGRVGAYVTLCSLSGMPLPLPDEQTGSALDFMINDPSIVENAPVDIDLDGDGFELVIGDGVGVLECVDGDGTVIPGRDCPCHPDMADALSVTLAFQAVPANILGVK